MSNATTQTRSYEQGAVAALGLGVLLLAGVIALFTLTFDHARSIDQALAAGALLGVMAAVTGGAFGRSIGLFIKAARHGRRTVISI